MDWIKPMQMKMNMTAMLVLDRELAKHDGVITQSVTLASEAVLLGTPALLISNVSVVFRSITDDGYPLFHRCNRVKEMNGRICWHFSRHAPDGCDSKQSQPMALVNWQNFFQ